ncbi:MAG: hypothetical protein LBS55_12685 [Prevotellaceae bacterium]|jgi:hypothetical protein|nr:hypothetical protein [Prevotellaceae bacterium]
MTTFKYWMVANFEIISTIVAGLISLLLALCFYNEKQHPDMSKGKFIVSIIFVLLMSCAQAKGRFFSIGKYILILIVILLYFIAVVFISKAEEVSTAIGMPAAAVVFAFIFLVAGTIVGIKLAIFTNRNIDEIVSRRMLYRNSSVQLFEIKWVYTLDRFAGVASSVTIGLCVMMYALIY